MLWIGLALAFLTACSTSKPDLLFAVLAQFEDEYRACLGPPEWIHRAPPEGYSPMFVRCMADRGWHLREP